MKVIAVLFVAGVAFAFPAPQSSTNCNAQTVQQLASGIQQNLNIQKQELQGVQALQKMVQAASSQGDNGANANANAQFKQQQSSVLNIQQQGITTRQNNQQLAKQLNSPASAGLAKVATAQVQEMQQVQQLTGSGSNDDNLLKMLVQEVNDGTNQNQMNKQAAQSQTCAK